MLDPNRCSFVSQHQQGSLGQEAGGAWHWQDVRRCLAVSVVVHGNPHRVGHCQGETGGSELEHKRS